MAEILGVIGSVGAIINIIDGTTKAISAISDMRGQWKDADLMLGSLRTRLTTFRAALRQIQEWRDSDLSEPHHQLVMDLDEALLFCAALMNRVKVVLVGWESAVNRPTATSSRWKVVVGRKGLDSLFVLVDQQTIALNFLLTACNYKTTAEQKLHLEAPKTREALQLAKINAVLLLPQRDGASVRTNQSRWSDNLSRVSLIFTFDPATNSSGAYNRVFRDLLKYRIRIHEERGWLMLKRIEPTPDPLDCEPGPRQACPPSPSSASFVTAQEFSEPLISPLPSTPVIPLFQDSRNIVEMTLPHMAEDCARFTIALITHIPKLRDKHNFPSLPWSSVRQGTPTYLPKVEKFWKHSDFARLLQTVLTSGIHCTPQDTPNPDNIAQLFFSQFKAISESRFPNQISNCRRSLSSSYAHSEILQSTQDGSVMALRAFLTWSKGTIKLEDTWNNYPFPRTAHADINILTVVVSVRITGHIHSHPVPDFTGLMDGRLNSWIDTAKERKPDKIAMVLLVQGMEYFLPRVIDASYASTQTEEVQAVYTQIMSIFHLFGSIQTRFPNEYLMVWDSPRFDEYLLGTSAVGGAAYRYLKPADSSDASLNPHTFTPYTLVEKQTVSPTSAIFTVQNRDGKPEPDSVREVWKRSVWSVQIKQPQLQIARAYTPLPPTSDSHKKGHDEPADIRLLIRQEHGGEVSTYIHRLPEETVIELRGPNTELELPHDIKEIIFLAGGTGIAPAMQVAQALGRRTGSKLHILWANRRRDECIGGVSDDIAQNTLAQTRKGWWQSLIGSDEPAQERLVDEHSGQTKGVMVQELDNLKERSKAGTRGLSVQYYVDEENSFIQPADLQRKINRAPEEKGSRLIMVSGPDGFIEHWAGRKKWDGGRETQGPLGGVLGKMELGDWRVFKL
ncbi:hypothetical protein CC86DRAFT_406431 [Ophiobolus disseminans]|uniref:FAD-binding FR-type domain-containing protein n=1 Tax=Ophiobolus disseminans TaxID=1469910 RepID=A0A6A7A036_9PLEO|nr:hypothetical protein CC86DRAFT_406431 [Ophiobolus disseminans]